MEFQNESPHEPKPAENKSLFKPLHAQNCSKSLQQRARWENFTNGLREPGQQWKLSFLSHTHPIIARSPPRPQNAAHLAH